MAVENITKDLILLGISAGTATQTSGGCCKCAYETHLREACASISTSLKKSWMLVVQTWALGEERHFRVRKVRTGGEAVLGGVGTGVGSSEFLLRGLHLAPKTPEKEFLFSKLTNISSSMESGTKQMWWSGQAKQNKHEMWLSFLFHRAPCIWFLSYQFKLHNTPKLGHKRPINWIPIYSLTNPGLESRSL